MAEEETNLSLLLF